VRYTLRPMRWRDARAISTWHYDGSYAFYDMNMLPAMLMQLFLKIGGTQIYYAVDDERGALVGFFSFVRHSDTIEVGLGMRPDLTGKGAGLEFVLAGLDFARRVFSPRHFYLTVATFNQRARRVYERAGFQPGRIFDLRTHQGTHEFLAMTRDA
jgi:[ribosomal protein S18]-alanine N-acetyltransferase